MTTRLAGFRETDVNVVIARRMKLWKILRALSQDELNRKILARTLNHMWVGFGRRGQLVVSPTVMCEIETQPMSYSSYMVKAEIACYNTIEVISRLGYNIYQRFDFERKSDGTAIRSIDGRFLITRIDLFVSRPRKMFRISLNPVREMLWEVTSSLPGNIKKRSKKRKRRLF